MSQEAADRLAKAREELFAKWHEARVKAVKKLFADALEANRKELELYHADYTRLVIEEAAKLVADDVKDT